MSKRGWSHESTKNKSIEWYTPPEIFQALNTTFDLDPCAAPGGAFVPAEKFFTKEDDGLSKPWRGFVFMNPPYGKDTPVWLDRLVEHGDGIALVFSRTDPKWFQETVVRASAVCFIAGRVRFFAGNTVDRGGSPGAGSCLIGFGERAREVLLRSGLGLVMEVIE